MKRGMRRSVFEWWFDVMVEEGAQQVYMVDTVDRRGFGMLRKEQLEDAEVGSEV